MTKFLKFPDQQTFLDACSDAGLTSRDEDGNTTISRYSHDHAMRVLGTLTETVEPAEYDDDEGEVVKEAVTEELEGWHVNYKGELPESFTGYVIDQPSRPHEIFAGDR